MHGTQKINLSRLAYVFAKLSQALAGLYFHCHPPAISQPPRKVLYRPIYSLNNFDMMLLNQPPNIIDHVSGNEACIWILKTESTKYLKTKEEDKHYKLPETAR